MKKFLEGLKDLLYDSVDYIIMFGIIIGVVFVIGWRLDVLFAKDALDMPSKEGIIVEENKNNTNKNEGTKDTNNEENAENNKEDKNGNNSATTNEIVKINIPAGSVSAQIGSILESQGLVSSKDDFVQKAQELKLDTKLKSGDFEINKNSSIEDILKILSK
ncbi:endolytic transglycosylase MltG [Tissierella sp. MSJ-40]|uniref:Endolytic transglycosylase MltG n=1 Tax=Tissierella simiarum TaxID=2841534 RepID=A0ABS6E3A5_9FIRM|nr:endolytic transglycosylase MltG [Tissierella simiarum]MBU5437384.1 endolytic transglycosylase MltG [Tissierella simiarum]